MVLPKLALGSDFLGLLLLQVALDLADGVDLVFSILIGSHVINGVVVEVRYKVSWEWKFLQG